MTEPMELHGSDQVSLSTAEWQARADAMRGWMLELGFDEATAAEDMRTAFGDVTFRDAQGTKWRHDGAAWWRWGAGNWTALEPPPELYIDTVIYEVEQEILEEDEVDDDEDEPVLPWAPPSPTVLGQPTFAPTHTVPTSGMSAWAAPDGSQAVVARLDPLLDVEVLEQRTNGWAHVRCSNGWEAWVDGRLLDAKPTS